jgi:hypothetical protein
MNFNNHGRAVRKEKILATPQGLTLTTLHINLDQPWRRISRNQEGVESDRWHVNNCPICQHGRLSGSFHATLRRTRSATAKRNFGRQHLRPNGGVDYVNGRLQVVSSDILAQPFDVPRIGLEGYDPAGRANQTRGAQGERSQMRSDVIDDVTVSHDRRNRLLYLRFVMAPPETRFLWNAQMHPHALREAGLHVHPRVATAEEVSPEKIFDREDTASRARPTAQAAINYRTPDRKVGAINREV